MLKSLVSRCKWAMRAFNASLTDPYIVLKNGILLDLQANRLIFPADFHLHASGNLRISSDKNIILSSGTGPDKSRDSYVYGVWINSEEDNQGNPILFDKSAIIEGNNDVSIDN